MEETTFISAEKRYAIVTGASKGIGLEICRQLASERIMAVLTARNEDRSTKAVETLKESGLSNVVCHQLDVKDPASIASIVSFIKSQIKKIDILVNNAAEGGAIIDVEAFRAYVLGCNGVADGNADVFSKFAEEPYEKVQECLRTSYYGTKAVTEALLPFLQLCDSPRIVNMSSTFGQLSAEVANVDCLTEERIDELLQWFLKDFKENMLKVDGWPVMPSAYKVSKAAINAFTRILARELPSFRINCVHPGWVKAHIACIIGFLTVEEGARAPVMVALLPCDGPSGCYFDRMYAVVTGANKGIGFEICRQLASNGVMVILTARNEDRGAKAVETLKASGLSNVVFHQLDIKDPTSIAALVSFIESQFKKIDILVNNAAEHGTTFDVEGFKAYAIEHGGIIERNAEGLHRIMEEPYEMAEGCLKTNYYGTKAVTDALLPFLRLSDSPRIVNISTSFGLLRVFLNEEIKAELNNVDCLTEERIDELLQWFLKDFKENMLEANGWPTIPSAYKVSKVAINAYARILARKFPSFLINSVNPGWVKTDFSCNTGLLSAEQGAKAPVMLALLPHDGPSGCHFDEMEVSTFI